MAPKRRTPNAGTTPVGVSDHGTVCTGHPSPAIAERRHRVPLDQGTPRSLQRIPHQRRMESQAQSGAHS
jgi:hypothetical protein